MNDAVSPHTPWVFYPEPKSSAGRRLFCIPYAGGGAAVFNGWQSGLPGVQVGLVRLPGRESRFHVRPHTRMSPLVDELTRALLPQADRPYALFGHSMGARVAFEVCRRVRALGGRPPDRLFVSGCAAPHLGGRLPTHHLPRAEFLSHVRSMGCASPEFFAQPELIDLMLPLLRADFSVVDTYTYTAQEPLEVPIHAFCGDADPHVLPEQAASWDEHTTSGFGLRIIQGGHFFLTGQRGRLLRAIGDDLDADVCPPGQPGPGRLMR